MIININDLPENISGIYKIVYDNNKIYIGQSQNIKKRAQEHNYKNKQPCDKALKKHSAILEILQTNILPEQLDLIETYWINKFEATNRDKGYNILREGNASKKKGIENPNSIFSQEQLNEIIDLLLNHTEYSYEDIAKKYKVSKSNIYKISKGYTYNQPNLKYPLRNNNHDSIKKNSIKDYNLTEQDIISIKDDLKYRWDLTIEKDFIKKYNLPLRIIRDINNGRKFENIGKYTYPIREKNIRNNHNFTQQDIINILDLLRNTKISMSEIGEKYHITRKTVSFINIGKIYIIKDYQYPSRIT